MCRLYPSAVVPQQDPGWDRSADLETIKATYAGYDAAGRGRLWDERNPGYARLVADLRGALLAALSSSLPHGVTPRILDLGCGSGELIEDARGVASPMEWIGVDLRPEAIAAATAAYPEATFIVASADEVPLPTASCDIVIARVLFSSLPSASLEGAVAREIGRLLKPHGWLVWLDIRYSNPTNHAVHGVSPRRLRSLFASWYRDVRTVGLLPPIARRLGFSAPVLYRSLSTIPAFRSHVVGRLRRPGPPHAS